MITVLEREIHYGVRERASIRLPSVLRGPHAINGGATQERVIIIIRQKA
jgi:hypothetical protein